MNTNKDHIINPIAIGYWKSIHEPELPMPQDFVDFSILDSERIKLTAYLKNGKRLIPWLGYSYCRFECGIEDSDMGSSCFTDGMYMWPEGLSHYIMRHQVWLPQKFIVHIIKNANRSDSTFKLSSIGFADYSWWQSQKEQTHNPSKPSL